MRLSRLRLLQVTAVLLATLAATPAPGSEPKPDTQASSAAQPSAAAPATEPPAPTPRLADVATPEAIVAALYDVISGPKGQARDWNRFRSLFAPGARMIPSGKRPDGTQGYRVLTPEEYIARSEQLLVEDGFRESEVHRVVERFGPLVHVFSTYEGGKRGTPSPSCEASTASRPCTMGSAGGC
jgi:hypothetical protein